MADEYQALLNNDTWRLMPKPPGANRHGIDYDETFSLSPVVKPVMIHAVLGIATSRQRPIHQLDVKNVFPHGHLEETIYCQQPPGFVDPSSTLLILTIPPSLRTWYQQFGTYTHQLGFIASATDTSLFVYRGATTYLLLYVDDIILTASSADLLQLLADRLHSEFAMTDLGDLHHFLGISVTRSSEGLFLSQRQYVLDLQRAGMAECHATSTLVDARAKLSATEGDPIVDPSEYRSLAGALQYLTLTCPDLAYAVQQACLFMHDPRKMHLALIKRILRYVKGSLFASLHIGTRRVDKPVAYSDANWVGCLDSHHSTLGFCVFLSNRLVSWSSKRAEAEYRVVAHVVAECCWLRQLLQELHVPLKVATVIYYDNVSAVYMAANPVHHRRTKHIEIDIHFIREKVALGEVRILHVPSQYQFADIMTKGLPVQMFQDFRYSLCIRSPDASTEGG
ncbi:LOW QUALITY PROTEIN: hypothetical protein U9M48_016313 [Paspalum notatum var. saurae]|uniref:Reverse transcriptase Ty1/copia-type domain-containing protein n=1 Tax=Paspalum notatum var. saurae TaxID=547442 RepID=A0AAQ3WMQ1_PASNO